MGSLTCTGIFLNAGIGANAHESHDDEFIDSSLYVPCRGTWSNGWYPTGEFSVTTVTYWFFGNGILNITTIVTPEPSTLALLGGGTLEILGAFRQKLRH